MEGFMVDRHYVIPEIPIQRRGSENCPYRYTADLLSLAQCVPRTVVKLPHWLSAVKTPLRVSAWMKALKRHPDQAYVQVLLTGMREGFRIGYNRTCRIQSASRNVTSALENPTVVEEYLHNEAIKERVLGPLDTNVFPGIQINPFGVIPKNKPGEWRLIVDLSAPEGCSVNDGIEKSLCSLRYITVDTIVEKIQQCGKGALLGKLDIKSAYRIIPVHPSDRMLLGMKWNGQLFLDTVLPFGLRSAPKIFNAVADALQWVMQQRGIELIDHYLDDFITVGRPRSPECQCNMKIALDVCAELGVPVANDKVDGPATCLDVLGIEIDTVAMEIRLPRRKLIKLVELVRSWKSRKAGRKQEVQSLVAWATSVMRAEW